MIVDIKNCVRIMKKDWKTTIKNKMILLPMILLPQIFSLVLPPLMLIGVLIDPEGIIAAFGNQEQFISLFNIPESYNQYLIGAEIMTRMMILPFFLFIPTFTAIIIASDSFAGEKERKTMESVALLPISKMELIFGKVLTAFIPAMVITFLSFIFLGIEINLMFLSHLDGNILIFLDPIWLLSVFVLTPTLSYVNILITVIISSRSKDFKSAQNISGVLVIPIITLMFMQMFNPAFMSPLMIIILSAAIGGVCLIFMDLANKLLDIERLILTL